MTFRRPGWTFMFCGCLKASSTGKSGRFVGDLEGGRTVLSCIKLPLDWRTVPPKVSHTARTRSSKRNRNIAPVSEATLFQKLYGAVLYFLPRVFSWTPMYPLYPPVHCVHWTLVRFRFFWRHSPAKVWKGALKGWRGTCRRWYFLPVRLAEKYFSG